MVRFRAAWVVLACAAGVLGGFFACDDPPAAEPQQDTDKDGLSDRDEVLLYGTSPVLADTDGDGLSDQVEIVKYAFDPANAPYRFNPRVADLPVPAIAYLSPPMLTLQLIDTEGEVRTFQTTQTASQASTASTSELDQTSHSNTLTTSHTETRTIPAADAGAQDAAADAGAEDAGAEGGARDAAAEGGEQDGDALDAAVTDGGASDAGARDDGAAASGPVTVANAVTPSATDQVVFAVTNLESATYTDTLAQADSYALSHNIASTTGVLLVTAVLENRGHVAFRISNLILGATLMSGSASFPVGNLVFDTPYNTFLPMSLGPGERTDPIVFDKELLTLETARAVLADVHALIVTLAVSDLTNAEGRPFAFDLMEIRTKTATVRIDYSGLLPAEEFHVATNFDPSQPGVTARKALEDILRIPIAASDAGLMAVRAVGVDTTGPGAWSLEHVHDDGAATTTTVFAADVEPYDFDRVVLYAGDVLHLTWSPR